MPEEESKKIFLDKRKLSTRYVPSNLPHRDKQLQELDNFFRDSLTEPSKDFLKALQIIGPAGSGKTSTVTHFGDNFEKEAKKVGVNLQHVYVNLKLQGGSRVLLYRYILDKVARSGSQGRHTDFQCIPNHGFRRSGTRGRRNGRWK